MWVIAPSCKILSSLEVKCVNTKTSLTPLIYLGLSLCIRSAEMCCKVVVPTHTLKRRLIFQVMSGPRKLSIKCRYSTTTYSRTNFNKTWTETLGIYPTKKHCFCISNEILLVSHTAYKLASLFCKKNQLIRVWGNAFFPAKFKQMYG